MTELSLDFLQGQVSSSKELDDIFGEVIQSREEAVVQAKREKRLQEVDASAEFDKLLAKKEILDVFIRLKDR